MFDQIKSLTSGVSSVVGYACGPDITVLNVIKQDKNFLSSPITMIYATIGQSS